MQFATSTADPTPTQNGRFARAYKRVATYAATDASASRDVAFELITDRAAFDALEAEWNALFERAGRGTQVFQTFNWNWHWANTYIEETGQGGPQLAIVTGRRNGELVVVWPLVKERNRGLTQVYWMGEPVSQYGDVLLDDVTDADAVLAASWAYLVKTVSCDIVRLRRVRADAVVAPLLKSHNTIVTDKLRAPYLDLASAPDFATYEQRYSSQARRNRKRLGRRLAEKAPLTFERHFGGAAAGELAAQSLVLKAKWLEAKGLVSQVIGDPRMAKFFSDAAAGGTHPTGSIVSVLKSNGEVAALEVSFVAKARLAMHVIVYNLEFEKAGAGVLLLEQSIRDGKTEGLEVYDMLAPGDGYKLDWADDAIDVIDYAKPMSVAGSTYVRVYLGLVRTRAKAAIAKMPVGLRRLIASSAVQA